VELLPKPMKLRESLEEGFIRRPRWRWKWDLRSISPLILTITIQYAATAMR
jgi:hypothetical protein